MRTKVVEFLSTSSRRLGKLALAEMIIGEGFTKSAPSIVAACTAFIMQLSHDNCSTCRYRSWRYPNTCEHPTAARGCEIEQIFAKILEIYPNPVCPIIRGPYVGHSRSLFVTLELLIFVSLAHFPEARDAILCTPFVIAFPIGISIDQVLPFAALYNITASHCFYIYKGVRALESNRPPLPPYISRSWSPPSLSTSMKSQAPQSYTPSGRTGNVKSWILRMVFVVALASTLQLSTVYASPLPTNPGSGSGTPVHANSLAPESTGAPRHAKLAKAWDKWTMLVTGSTLIGFAYAKPVS